MDHILHRLGYAAAGGKAHAGSRRLIVGGVVLDLVKVDALGVEHPPQLLKGQHEVHIAADGAAAGLQLLGGAGPDERHPAAGVLLLLQAGRQHHGRHGHGNVRCKAGELLLSHDRPRRAAGGRHKRLLLRHIPQEFLRLLDGAQVGADGHLHQRVEAQQLHGLPDLPRRHVVAELSPECRCDDGDHLIALLDGVDQLEQLALIHNGAKGAVHQTHTAVDALVVVDIRPTMLILPDGVHTAGLLTGAGELDDGLIGAGVLALAALDAQVLVDDRLPSLRPDGALGTGVLAVPRQTALTGAGHLIVGGRTGVAGILDDVDQRRIVVFLRDGALLHAVGQQRMLRHRTQGQSHSQPDPLAHDGALQKDGFPLPPDLAGYDLIGQLLDPGVVAALVGQLRHLGKDALADIRHAALDVSHSFWFLPHRCVCL